jgi:hypothetical protein
MSARQASGPTQPRVEWVLGAPFPGLKRQKCESEHSPLSNAKVKNVEAIRRGAGKSLAFLIFYLQH